MRHSFQKKVIEGLDLSHDLLVWLPLLETAGNPNAVYDEGAPILDLGPVEFARVAMATVEQYAREKKLNPGTTEGLRYNAVNLYLSATAETSYRNGQTDVLRGLAQQKPELQEWVSAANQKIGTLRKAVWHKTALAAHIILNSISKQQKRKGKRGRVSDGEKTNSSPALVFRELLYSEIINTAANSVEPSQRNDISIIRSRIRPAVSDFLGRGCLSYDDNLSTGENIDRHAKNVLRRFDADIDRLVASGQLIKISKSEK